MAKSKAEESVKRCYSTWGKTYYDDYYGESAAYPPVHRELITSLLIDAGAKTVLDAGCGPASLLRDLIPHGLDVYGFDLTPEMVAEGKRVMQSMGLASERLWEGSVLDGEAYRNRNLGFDATICIGVMPHLPLESDRTLIGNLRESVRSGGLVIVEARNQFFSLFTLNRYTYEFLVNELIRPVQRDANDSVNGLDRALAQIKDQLRMDLPPIRKGKRDEPGYDEVISRTHNPLLLAQQFSDAGFTDVQTLFYHYHCLPPMCAEAVGDLFRKQSLAMEDPHDWRGYFMASAFLITGRRE